MAFLRLRNQEGVVLPIALGILAVLSIAVVVVIESSSSSARSSKRSGGDKVAFALAEAGINNSMAVLNLETNNALKQETLVSCTSDAETTWNRSNYEGGYVLWCGTFNATGAYWDVTALGKVRNPNGTKVIERRIGARVVVTPTYTQPLNNPAWNYIYSTRTGNTCDQYLSNNVGGGSRFYITGNLCLNNNVGITSSSLIVGGNLDLANNAFVGSSSSMSTRVETYVGGNCRYGGGSWADCVGNQDSRRIYSKKDPPSYVVGVNGTPPVIGVPASDFALWYTNSIPGPTSPCTTVSGTPPVFDNDTTRNNSVTNIFDLTPSTSYTCRVGPAGSPSGELSWNASTRVLTVSGTIYIDGSARVGNGLLNQYNGQATLYLSGTFRISGSLCGGIVGSACDFSAWNPNTEMLTIVAESTGGQNSAGTSIAVTNNGSFQGGLFATGAIEFSNNSKSDGPMVGTHIIMANNMTSDSFPTITTVPVGMPGNPAVYAQPNPPQMFSG
jgi:Tfp pilus assembly protein PilX